MGCMKCGRDVEEGQVFCPVCLENMEKYPVKPGTPVHIPVRRQDPPVRRPARRRTLSPEEQLRKLRRRNRSLAILAALLLVASVLLGTVAVRHFLEDKGYSPGQNYSPITVEPQEGT